MSALRLAAIKICGYRGFPIPATIWLSTHDAEDKPTGKGKNLLLYGENGSGKSSIGKALKDFLDFRSSAPKFDDFKYRYTDPPRTDRSIMLVFDNPAADPLTWNPTDRDTAHRDFSDMARARGWLDYRVVWRASEVQFGSDSVDIFKPLVEDIIPGCLPPDGGAETFGELWDEITEMAATRPTRTAYRWQEVEDIEDNLSSFNNSLKTFVEKLQSLSNDLLKEFTPHTTVELQWVREAKYDSGARGEKFSLGSICLKMKDRDGDPLKNPSEFLNEARLTAVGLCLYLAGLSLSIPPRRADNSTYPRLLVLDDVLLSLDMAHRQPLLTLVKHRKFRDWQILLLTHDRAWYELAKQELDSEVWAHCELFTQQVGDYEQPIVQPDLPHIERARGYLAPPAGSGRPIDMKAAAVHLRTEFELILKTACEGLQLPVPFRRNPRDINANLLWCALQTAEAEPFPLKVTVKNTKGAKFHFWQSEKKRRIVPESLRRRVSFALSWVLNPLSHSESIERHSREVKDAPEALKELARVVQEAITQKGQQELIARSTILSALVQKPDPTATLSFDI